LDSAKSLLSRFKLTIEAIEVQGSVISELEPRAVIAAEDPEFHRVVFHEPQTYDVDAEIPQTTVCAFDQFDLVHDILVANGFSLRKVDLSGLRAWHLVAKVPSDPGFGGWLSGATPPHSPGYYLALLRGSGWMDLACCVLCFDPLAGVWAGYDRRLESFHGNIPVMFWMPLPTDRVAAGFMDHLRKSEDWRGFQADQRQIYT
jgi:hypothetical protein